MPGLSMSLLASQDGRIAHVRLFGDNGFEASAINAETISDYVASRRFGALIIDWSECSMLQTAPQFDAVAARFAARLSPTTRFIVLHRPDQFGHALFLTRALHRKRCSDPTRLMGCGELRCCGSVSRDEEQKIATNGAAFF
jgi:hypothetical protein